MPGYLGMASRPPRARGLKHLIYMIYPIYQGRAPRGRVD